MAPFGNLLIALGVAYVAWRQWLTAREKLILDLFQKRLEIYEDLRALAKRVVAFGTASDQDIAQAHDILTRCRFLFGEDIARSVEAIKDAVVEIAGSVDQLRIGGLAPEFRKEAIDTKYRGIRLLKEFFEQMPQSFRPYMQMKQKLPFHGRMFRWRRS